MGGTYFKINTSDLMKTLNNGLEKIGKTKELMETIGEVFVSGAKERFEDEKAPDSTAWVKGKKKSGKTLSGQTGNLKKSIIIFKADITEVIYGSNLEYAAIHQKGGEIKARNKKALSFIGADGKRFFVKKVTIPARPFIGISEDDKEEAREMIALHIKNSFGGLKK